MAPLKYINRPAATYEKMFEERPSAKMYSPLDKRDHPDLDDSGLFDAEEVQLY